MVAHSTSRDPDRVASLGDASEGHDLLTDWLRSYGEVTADVATSLEALLAAQCQNISQCRKLANTIDLDQSLRLRSTGPVLEQSQQ